MNLESVRRFDPAADRVALARGSLREELFEVLLAAGVDQDEASIGAGMVAEHTFSATSPTPQDHRDGTLPVEAMLSRLGQELDNYGPTPNPLAGQDAAALIADVVPGGTTPG